MKYAYCKAVNVETREEIIVFNKWKLLGIIVGKESGTWNIYYRIGHLNWVFLKVITTSNSEIRTDNPNLAEGLAHLQEIE